MHVVGDEIDHLESEGTGGVIQFEVEVGAGPVNDRHEVVADAADTLSTEIAERLAVVFDQFLVAASAQLDVLVHGDALNHNPRQAMLSEQRLAGANVFRRPDLSGGNMIQRRNNAGSASLDNLLQGNRVIWAEPAPGFLHVSVPARSIKLKADGKGVVPFSQADSAQMSLPSARVAMWSERSNR